MTTATRLAPTRQATSARSAVVTLLGIGGSIATVFLSVGLWLAGMGFVAPGTATGKPLTAWFVALGITTVIVPPFAGGGLWGWGIARIFDRPGRPAAAQHD